MANKNTHSSSLKLGQTTLPHPLILAPMCGITLKPFRQICKKKGAGLVFNQMVSAKALVMGDRKSHKMLDFDESERPIGMQLFGNDATVLSEAAKIVEATGPDVIDLNLGCPAKKIVNDGGGSALLNDENKLQDILKKMRHAIQGTFTIKIRAGWDEKSKNALNVAKIAENEGVDALAIHARTRAQGYSGHSDWSVITKIKDAVRLPIIGNGDIETAQDAERMMQQTGCDAVMTGRGAFATPWIFDNFTQKQEKTPSLLELKDTILEQYEGFRCHFGELTGLKMMRKFLCVYTKGQRNSAPFRADIIRLTSWSAIQMKIDEFFK